MKKILYFLAVISSLLILSSCDDDKKDKPVADNDTITDNDIPDTETPDADEGRVQNPDIPENSDATDNATVFEFNPLKTPNVMTAVLPWIAAYDDNELSIKEKAYLTGLKDDEGIRKLKAYNCPDIEGFAIEIPKELLGLPVDLKVHTCSPTQMANKNLYGSFEYNDYEDGKGPFDASLLTFDKIDLSAEVSMYYHASKIYKYLVDLGVEGFKHLDNHEQQDGSMEPINLIANFTMPDMNDYMGLMNGTNGIAAFDNAFFMPNDPMYSALFGSFGIKGDMLVFGQATYGDTAYDGEVVYHEFGHATIHSTAKLESGMNPDMYGISNIPGAIHEGVADTFAFIISPDPCMAEFASEVFSKLGGEYTEDGDFVCMRHAENENVANEDFIGEVHYDGRPMLAANWAIYQLMKEKGIGSTDRETLDKFAKLLLKTLLSMADPYAYFKTYADSMLAVAAADEELSAITTDMEKIFTDRHFFDEIRARSAEKKIDITYTGGASENSSSGTSLTITEGDSTANVSPSYMQFYYKIPENMDMITISATPAASGSSLTGSSGTVDYKVFLRKEAPIEYSYGASAVEVAYDAKADMETNTWTFTGLEAGKKYYFQFINYGTSEGTLSNITVTASKMEETPDEDVITDNETSDDDTATIDEDEIVQDEDITNADEDTAETPDEDVFPSICGNGDIEGNEECDDSNLVSGDGCSSLCTIEPPVTK